MKEILTNLNQHKLFRGDKMTQQEFDILVMKVKKLYQGFNNVIDLLNSVDRDLLIDANDPNAADPNDPNDTNNTPPPTQQKKKVSTTFIKDPVARKLAEKAQKNKEKNEQEANEGAGVTIRTAPYKVIVRGVDPYATQLDIFDPQRNESASLDVESDVYQEIKTEFDSDPDASFEMELDQEELDSIGKNWLSENVLETSNQEDE